MPGGMADKEKSVRGECSTSINLPGSFKNGSYSFATQQQKIGMICALYAPEVVDFETRPGRGMKKCGQS